MKRPSPTMIRILALFMLVVAGVAFVLANLAVQTVSCPEAGVTPPAKRALVSSITIACALVAILALWLFARYGWSSRTARHTSSPARTPVDWPTRIGEAIILMAIAAPILLLTTTSFNTGGMLLRLEDTPAGYARVYIVVFAVAAVLVALSAIIMLLGKTILSVVLTGFTLGVYAYLLGGGSYPLEGLVPETITKPIPRYVISLSGEIKNAELWVNDVHLGKTPVTITVDEFHRKVPYWPKPPKGYKDGTDEVRSPHYELNSSGWGVEERWMEFQPGQFVRDEKTGHKWDAGDRKFYARIRVGNTWGCGHGGNSGRDSQRFLSKYATEYFSFRVRFPQHERAVADLLKLARLKDYSVDEQWFRAMESYGELGWETLREITQKGCPKEPELPKLYDAWATWKYNLGSVQNSHSAWQILTHIIEQADRDKNYHPGSPTGRAVELLLPKIDAEQLADKAIAMIRGPYRQYPLKKPSSDYLLAHAVWVLDMHLDEIDDTTPNIIELKVTPELIRWPYRWPYSQPYRWAAIFGGPDVTTFLVRKVNRTVHRRELDWEDTEYLHGTRVNKWLYLLGYLSGQEAPRYRTRYQQDYLQMLKDFFRSDIQPDLSYLPPSVFRAEDNESSLAWKYWNFHGPIKTYSKYDFLKNTWDYLGKIGEEATAKAFVRAWEDYHYDYSWRQGAIQHSLAELPSPLREEVADALLESVRQRTTVPENDRRSWKNNLQGWQNYLTSELEKYASDSYLEQSVLKRLRQIRPDDPNNQYWQRVAKWLEHTRPDHPLVETLARQDDPAMRLLVIGALQAYPTPRNRKVLDTLLTDNVPRVREAAVKVKKHLEEFAKEGPKKFAADTSEM